MKHGLLLVLSVCSIAVVAQSPATLTVAEINQLLPDKIMKGYNLTGSTSSKVMKVGTLKYSLAEKKFSSGSGKIKILLFDYLEAPIMYTQATGKFAAYAPIENDSVIVRPYEAAEFKGWGSENSRSPSSQVTLGISNRYYLILEGEKIRLEELQRVLEYIDIKSFPR